MTVASAIPPSPSVEAAAIIAAQLVCSGKGRGMSYAGNAAAQRKPDFLAVPSFDDTDRPPRRPRGPQFVPAGPPLVKSHTVRQIRDGCHVGYGAASVDPYAWLPKLDPFALREMKIRDPVAYHAFVNNVPWVTQSTLIGEHLRRAAPTQRVPEHVPVGASKREALRALRAASEQAIGAALRPTDMDGVIASRGGFLPSPPREEDDAKSVSMKTYVDLRTLPEPATCKAPRFEERTLYSKWPTDTTARDALATLRDAYGTIVPDCPPGVHPSIHARERARDRAMTLDDPHAHKLRRSRTQPPALSQGRPVTALPGALKL